MMALGQMPGRSAWLYPPALLLFGAALIRTLAALMGNASFSLDFIGAEIIMGAILVFTARKISESS